MISSCVATSIAEIATLPICTVKTNYQNTTGKSITAVTKDILRQYGVRGFYNASGWGIASQTLSTSSKYTLYKILTPYTDNSFVAGAISGALSSMMTHPFDVVKVHYQMHTPFLPEFRKHGPFILYRGYSKTLPKAVLGSVMFFPLYDKFNLLVGNNIVAAVMSATVATTILQPIDYMKTRHIYGQVVFSGWNPRPYFKGLSINLLRVVPHFMMIMTIIEYIKSVM